jgi:hypothetical protein
VEEEVVVEEEVSMEEEWAVGCSGLCLMGCD